MIKNKLPETNLTLSDFYYELPQEYIAQTPIEPRDSSRLMIFDRRSGELKHEIFKSIINYINPEDILVLNDTRVIPARIIGHRTYRRDSTDKRSQLVKSTGTAPVELLLLKQTEHNMWEALAGPGKRARPGDIIEFGGGKLNAYIENIIDGGCRLVRLEASEEFHTIYDALNELGSTPLPPYITEKLDNPERYQTVYSKIAGSAAAPTAGLHFTNDLLNSIRSKGCGITHVLLHVGLGTFRPVKENNISEHVMHSEFISVSDSDAEEINERRKKGGRIIAVGTTSCRVLESVSDENGIIRPYTGDTGIFIYPGYKFKATDALITNFHLPESTLLMLVSAFAGKEQVLNAYKTAVNLKYRFFSFGDAMFIG